jgi:hypothetical protein
MAMEPRFGHRDCFSDEPEEFKAWSTNFIEQLEKNHERWGIPKEVIEVQKATHAAYLQALIDEQPPGPPQPDPIDGFTIYWNRQKRFQELLCDCFEVPINARGVYDVELLAERMLEDGAGNPRWRDYLHRCALETARRYQMDGAWVETIRERVAAVKTKDIPAENGMEQVFLLFNRRS